MKKIVRAYILEKKEKERDKLHKEELKRLLDEVEEEFCKDAHKKMSELSIRIDSKIGRTVLNKVIREINKKLVDLSIETDILQRELNTLKEKRFRVYRTSIQKEANEFIRQIVQQEIEKQNDDFKDIKSSFRALNLDFIRFEKGINEDIAILRRTLGREDA